MPPAGHLPNPGIELVSPAMQVNSLPSEPPGKSMNAVVGIYPFSPISTKAAVYGIWSPLIGGSDSKESVCSVGDLVWIPGLGRSPGGGHGNPLQYSCLENPHGQRILVGYSPRGRKESDTTEPLSSSR